MMLIHRNVNFFLSFNFFAATKSVDVLLFKGFLPIKRMF